MHDGSHITGIADLVDGVYDDVARATTTGKLITGLQTMPDGATVLVMARPEVPAVKCGIVAGHLTPGAGVSADELVPIPVHIDLAPCEDLDEARESYDAQLAALTTLIARADQHLAAWTEHLNHTIPGARLTVVHDPAAAGNRALLPVQARCPDTTITVRPEITPRRLEETDPTSVLRMRVTQGPVTLHCDPDRPAEETTRFLDRAAASAARYARSISDGDRSVDWFCRLNDQESNG